MRFSFRFARAFISARARFPLEIFSFVEPKKIPATSRRIPTLGPLYHEQRMNPRATLYRALEFNQPRPLAPGRLSQGREGGSRHRDRSKGALNTSRPEHLR